MDYVMRRRSTVGGALEMFSLPLPLPFPEPLTLLKGRQHKFSGFE